MNSITHSTALETKLDMSWVYLICLVIRVGNIEYNPALVIDFGEFSRLGDFDLDIKWYKTV